MEKRIHKYSILKRLTLLLLLMYLALFGLMLFNDVYAIQTARGQICLSLRESLHLYNRQIASSLSNAEVYLAGLSGSASAAGNLKEIEKGQGTTAYFTAVSREKLELDSALSTMDLVEGLFVFSPVDGLFISSAKDGNKPVANVLRDMTRKSQEADTLSQLPKKKWFPAYAYDGYILIRYFRVGNSYAGAWTSFSKLLTLIETDPTLGCQPLFSFPGKHTYTPDSQKSTLRLAPQEATEDYTMLSADENYLMLSTPAQYAPEGYVVLLIPDSKISAKLMENYLLMAILGASFLVLALLTLTLLRRSLRRPIDQLRSSIEALRKGDFNARVTGNYECLEFLPVNTAFNETVQKIEDLKIHVYEEKLAQQSLEMKFLRSQVAPHFLINCLNGIYHMAGAKETQLIQKMAVSLGHHLRYALAERPLVPLAQELEMTENYIALSQLRFPNCLRSYSQVDPRTADASTLPMLVLTFVENTVKYSVVMGKIVEVHMETEWIEGDREKDSDTVLIRVWDTGAGWSEEQLEAFNRGHIPSSEDGARIGLRNIFQRGRLTYEDRFHLRFSNRPGAGAQLELEFPYEPYSPQEKGGPPA